MSVKNIIGLILLLQANHALGSCCSSKGSVYRDVVPPMRVQTDCKPLKYHQVYNPLFQAVFEGDLDKFLSNLAEYKHTLYQRVSYNRTLRHFAFLTEIDQALTEHRVAPSHMIQVGYISSKDALIYDSRGQYIPKTAYTYRWERHPAGCDIYDKFPEDYTQEQRRDMANSMIVDEYTGPLK